MIGLLLALQAPPPVGCSAAALCRLVEAAAATNRTAGFAPGGYRAVAETETATLARWEGRIEGAKLLEQTSSTVRWSNDEGFAQRVAGSRSYPNAIPLSRLTFMRIGWVVPSLAGERLAVIPRNGPGETRFRETLSGPLAPTIVVHPLAADRARYYRFSGGDRVTRTIDGVALAVDQVEVTPIVRPAGQALFEGEMDLDPGTHAVVRLLGRLAMPGAGRHGGMGLSRMFEPDEVLVDLTARLLPGAGWVPRTQRFEIRTDDAMARGFGASRRVISRFYDPEALPRDPGALSLTTTMGYTLSAARRDSLRRFRDWHTGAGAMTDAATDEEFSRFRPAGLQPSGRPVVLIKGYNTGDFIHLNRIEGPFTGASVIVPLRDAAPGLSLRAMAGYGWSEQTVRGAAGARWSAGGWQLSGGVARTLDVTNDFRDQFDNPNFGALAGRDPWDFVERRGGGVGAARRLDRWGSLVQVELAGVEDRAVTRHLNYSLFGRRLRDNRGVTGGSYLRTRLLLDWNPAVSPSVARDGIGVRLEGENAGGDLDYTRVEGRVVVRKSLRPLFLMVRLHGGAVLADVPPPQQLFELGGPAGFPGYQYKEYAGNRAALFRTRITYPLPLLDTPIRVGRGITLPALAPAVSVGFQSGMADARSANAREAVRSLGVLRNEETGVIVTDPETGATLPASVPTGRLKSSIDIRIGVFGDALGVGVARALEKGRTSTWFVVLGRQF